MATSLIWGKFADIAMNDRYLAFNNRIADREATFKRLNGNNPATSGTNLMNFRPII